jgi:hypothetical protein
MNRTTTDTEHPGSDTSRGRHTKKEEAMATGSLQ